MFEINFCTSSTDHMLWYQTVLDYIEYRKEESSTGVRYDTWRGEKYICSWWLARELNMSTKNLNYRLDKVVKAGKLKKETDVTNTKYIIDGLV
jgi:predicted HTH transcriptional regulator